MIGAWPALRNLPRAFWAAGFAGGAATLLAGAVVGCPVDEELTELGTKADVTARQNNIVKRVSR